jgi:hypothetical protein
VASTIDVIISYIIYFLPTIVLSGLTIIIGLVVYYIGKKTNINLMDSSFNKFKNISKGKIKNLELVESDTIGRTYLGEVEEGSSLINFRLHFTMIHRHLIISRVASLVKKKFDYVLFEADPADKVVKRYQIEVLNKDDKKRIESLADMLYKLEHLPLGSRKFEEEFIIRVNDLEFFQAAFKKDPQIIKYLYSVRHSLIRLSYYPLAQPSIRMVALLKEDLNPKFFLEILFNLTEAMSYLGQKSFYSKKPVGDSQVIKDISLEKGKRKSR